MLILAKVFNALFCMGILFILNACQSKKVISNLNLATLYAKDNYDFDIQNNVLHLNDTLSRLNITFNQHQLLFVKNKNGNYQANFELYYLLYSSMDSEEIIDSSKVQYSINQYDSSKTIAIDLPCKKGRNYELIIRLRDLERMYDCYALNSIDKQNWNSLGYYEVSAHQKYGNALWIKSDSLHLKHFKKQNDYLWLNRLKVEWNIPSSAYQLNYSGDDVFQLKTKSKLFLDDNGAVDIALEDDFYFIQVDSSKNNGVLIHKCSSSHPLITAMDQLVLPLSYLMAKEDFERMRNSRTLKKSFEQFWLNENEGNPDKARKAIKNYYEKVHFANAKFSTYKPGWMTDMGMVYIVKGAPQNVKKTKDKEVWYYGETAYSDPEVFVFFRKAHAIYPNNFELNRSPENKRTWDRNVELIKKGQF